MGRAAASTARASPSKNRCRCQASAIGRGAAAGLESRGGTSRSTSRAQTGSRRARAACSGGLRSHSDTGARASRPRAAKQRARGAAKPARCTAADSSSSSLVFPTPASPDSTAMPGDPASVSRQHCCSSWNSRSRPISRTGLLPGRCTWPAARAAVAPIPVRRAPARAGSSPRPGPARRSYSAMVAWSGLTPSSRSSTDTQR
jgi:hypothetical protein